MRYIKYIRDYCIIYRKGYGLLKLEGYSDLNWGADLTDRKLIGFYIFILVGGLIFWVCKRNYSVCLLSIEAEYKVFISAVKEAVWDRRCFADIGYEQKEFIVVYCDN